MQTPEYQLLLTHVKPNGYIGIGMHSWEKFKASHLDDGENAARLLHNYGIPKDMPIVQNFVKAMRDDAILEQEFSYYNPEKVRFETRSIGINSGSSLDVTLYACQALLGHGDDPEMRHFVDASYKAFVSLLDYESADEITTFNPNLKRKYNYPTITPDTYFPCQYHLETLAETQSWRTEESIARLAEAIDHHDRITKDFGGFAVKINGKQVGPGWAYMNPFFALSFPQKAPNHRKTLTALAKVTGDRTQVVRESVETLLEMLSEDGVLRTTFSSSYEKSRFKDNFRSGHPYAEIGLEPDHRKDTSGKVIETNNYQEPLSPALRQEQIYLERYMETVNLINRNDLGTAERVQEFINDKESEMATLLSARNKIDNRRRRAKTDIEKEECSRKRKAISAELKAIRHDINLAKGIFPMIDNLKEKLRIEMEQEQEMFPRETGAKIQSKTKRNEEKQR